MKIAVTTISNVAGHSGLGKNPGGSPCFALDSPHGAGLAFAGRGMGGGGRGMGGGGRGMGGRGRGMGSGRRGLMGLGSGITGGQYIPPAHEGFKKGWIRSIWPWKSEKQQLRPVPQPIQNLGKERRLGAEVDQERCNGCGACLDICPVGAIAVKGGKASVDAESCLKCGACVNGCPVGAISFYR